MSLSAIPLIVLTVLIIGGWRNGSGDVQADPFISPVDMEKGKVSAPFGERVNPFTGKKEIHTGIDIEINAGEPVVAAAKGKVVTATSDEKRGNYVVIEHDNSFTTSYSHLKSLYVQSGDIVESGKCIGFVGSTGLSTGPHLHFEVLQNGKAINPAEHLPSR